MKTIKFTIPTSVADIKTLLKERTDKKYKHNRDVLCDLYQQVMNKIKGGYWDKELSDDFKKNFDCRDLFNQALRNLQ